MKTFSTIINDVESQTRYALVTISSGLPIAFRAEKAILVSSPLHYDELKAFIRRRLYDNDFGNPFRMSFDVKCSFLGKEEMLSSAKTIFGVAKPEDLEIYGLESLARIIQFYTTKPKDCSLCPACPFKAKSSE